MAYCRISTRSSPKSHTTLKICVIHSFHHERTKKKLGKHVCKWNENNTSLYLLVSHDGNSSSALHQLLIALINVYLFSLCSFPLSPHRLLVLLLRWERVRCDRKQNRTEQFNAYSEMRDRERADRQITWYASKFVWYSIFFARSVVHCGYWLLLLLFPNHICIGLK